MFTTKTLSDNLTAETQRAQSYFMGPSGFSASQDVTLPPAADRRLWGYWIGTKTADPDLIIRTAGELSLSNFMLWQSAYSEYYHTPTLWPDLDAGELELALASFTYRQRRFGRISPED